MLTHPNARSNIAVTTGLVSRKPIIAGMLTKRQVTPGNRL